MDPYLEQDFAEQQTKLMTLLDDRKNLQHGSPEAAESERQITAAENLILSYQALKWYER